MIVFAIKPVGCQTTVFVFLAKLLYCIFKRLYNVSHELFQVNKTVIHEDSTLLFLSFCASLCNLRLFLFIPPLGLFCFKANHGLVCFVFRFFPCKKLEGKFYCQNGLLKE